MSEQSGHQHDHEVDHDRGQGHSEKGSGHHHAGDKDHEAGGGRREDVRLLDEPWGELVARAGDHVRRGRAATDQLR